jgi:hypothetical protein
MNAAEPLMREPKPVEIDPQTCELCGCRIEDLEELIYVRADDLIAQWERADPRDRWRYTGSQPPREVESVPTAAQPYRTPESVIQAFWYVVGLNDSEYLARWLADHAIDAPHLRKLVESKNA